MKSIKTLFVLLIALTVATTASAYNFTKDLELGSRGSDVTKLQEMLSGAGYLETDSVTGYFGPATELAVAKWQISNDIKPISGIFGAISRAAVASVPVANLSADSSSYRTPSFLTPDQAKYAVDTLVKAKLISSRKSDIVFNLLVSGSNPSIPVMTLNPHVALLGVKDSGQHGFEAEAAVPTDSIKTWMYTFFHDGNVKIMPEGRDLLEDGNIYFPRMNGESFDIKFTADNLNSSTESVKMLVRGYSSAVTSHNQDYLVAEGTTVFKVAPKTQTGPGNSGNKLNVSIVNDGQTTDGYSKYRLVAPNNGRIAGWVKEFSCPNGIELNMIGGGSCGESLINGTNGGPLNFGFNIKNSSLTKTENIKVSVWGYSQLDTDSVNPIRDVDFVAYGDVSFSVGPVNVSIPVKPTPVVAPVKLTSAQICAVIQKPTTSVCSKSYPINKGIEKMTGYVYNGFKYDISYKRNANSSGAICRDTCTAKVY